MIRTLFQPLPQRLFRPLFRSLAGSLSLASALALATAVVPALIAGSPARAADPPKKIDCSKYTGTEREACEKMMGKKKQ